jgi:hypothetical protein
MRALGNRAITQDKQGDTAGALAELKRVAGLPSAPPEVVAQARQVL